MIRLVKKRKNLSEGVTLIELLVYVSVSVILTIAILTFVVSLIKTQGKVSIEREAWESSQRVIDQVARELQKATQINEAQSIFGSNPGVLDFETYRYDSDDKINMKIYKSGNQAYLQTTEFNDALTAGDVNITNLVFELYNSANGAQAVKINITAQKTKVILGETYRANSTLERLVTLRN